MLEKIAKLAHEFDRLEMYREADVLTQVLMRCAASFAGDLEDDDDSEPPYVFQGYDKRWNQRPEIDVDDVDFLREFEERNPTGYQWWMNRRNTNPGNRAKETVQYIHGIPVRLSPGHSDLKPSEIARFIYPDNVLSDNADNVRRHFERATQNRKRRGTFNIDYASGKGPEPNEDLETYRARLARPRKFVFDPYLLEKFVSETGRETSGLPVFDADVYNGLFNPVSKDFDKYESQREKITSGEKGIGWLAGHAYRHLDPSQTFGFGVAPRETGENGKKKPNWYLMSKKILRLSWHRGEFSGEQLAHEVITNGAGGAAAGAVAGLPAGGIGAGPGALIGGAGGMLFGAGSYGVTNLWYATRSNEEKAAWQAADVESNTKAIGDLLQQSSSPQFKQLGAGIKTLGQEFKQYIDYYIQGHKNIDLSNNSFERPAAPQESIDPNDPRKTVPSDSSKINSSDAGSNLSPSNPEPSVSDNQPWAFNKNSSNKKFIRIAIENSSIPGDVAGLIMDSVGAHFLKQWLKAHPGASAAQVANAKQLVQQQVDQMSRQQLLDAYRTALSKGFSGNLDAIDMIQQVTGKTIDKLTSEEIAQAQSLLSHGSNLNMQQAQKAFSLLSEAEQMGASKTINEAAAAAKSIVPDAIADAGKIAIQDAPAIATKVAPNVLKNAWKGFGLPLIAGTAAQMLTDWGLNSLEDFVKGAPRNIIEKASDSLEAIDEIIKLTQNNPQATLAGQKLAGALHYIIEIQQNLMNASKQLSSPTPSSQPQLTTNGVVPLNSLQTQGPNGYSTNQ